MDINYLGRYNVSRKPLAALISLIAPLNSRLKKLITYFQRN